MTALAALGVGLSGIFPTTGAVSASTLLTAAAVGTGAGMMASGAMTPKMPGMPTPPIEADTKEAVRKVQEEARTRRGRRASIMTGGAGLTAEPTLGKATLLGGGF